MDSFEDVKNTPDTTFYHRKNLYRKTLGNLFDVKLSVKSISKFRHSLSNFVRNSYSGFSNGFSGNFRRDSLNDIQNEIKEREIIQLQRDREIDEIYKLGLEIETDCDKQQITEVTVTIPNENIEDKDEQDSINHLSWTNWLCKCFKFL